MARASSSVGPAEMAGIASAPESSAMRSRFMEGYGPGVVIKKQAAATRTTIIAQAFCSWVGALFDNYHKSGSVMTREEYQL